MGCRDIDDIMRFIENQLMVWRQDSRAAGEIGENQRMVDNQNMGLDGFCAGFAQKSAFGKAAVGAGAGFGQCRQAEEKVAFGAVLG